MYTWFDSKEQREATIEKLQAMPPSARRLLEQAVTEQFLKRQAISASARMLENAGLLFCRQSADWEPWVITPSLWGEEALHRIEIREKKRKD